MNFIVSASTDIGNTKHTNQDSLNVKVISSGLGKMVFAVLCDGMGGLEKGEIASASVVHAFSRWAKEQLSVYCSEQAELSKEQIRSDWEKIIRDMNEKIKVYGKKSAVSLGTTVTAVLLAGKHYYIVNVGDTRAYEIENSAEVLTKDQTVVAREVELGNITQEQARTDSRRSVLLQCVGASDIVYPDFFFGDTKKDAVYMLCSDGFRHEVSADEIGTYFKPDRMVSQTAMQENEQALIRLNKQRQERDNISVITIRTF